MAQFCPAALHLSEVLTVKLDVSRVWFFILTQN